jgi:hypothetical protein
MPSPSTKCIASMGDAKVQRDWEAINAAFLGHTDPMLGAEAGVKYDALFTRIVNLALQQHRKNMN